MSLTDITWWLNTILIPQGYATCSNEILYQNIFGHTLIVAFKSQLSPLPYLEAEYGSVKTESCMHFLNCLYAACHSWALV